MGKTLYEQHKDNTDSLHKHLQLEGYVVGRDEITNWRTLPVKQPHFSHSTIHDRIPEAVRNDWNSLSDEAKFYIFLMAVKIDSIHNSDSRWDE